VTQTDPDRSSGNERNHQVLELDLLSSSSTNANLIMPHDVTDLDAFENYLELLQQQLLP